MKVQKKRLLAHVAKFALTALLASALAFTGCSSDSDDDDDDDSDSPIPVTSIVIKDAQGNTSSSVAQEGTVVLTATVKPSAATDKDILWTCTGDDNVTLSATETSGKTSSVTVTVGKNAAVGAQALITATSKGTPSVKGTYTVTVLKESTITIGDITLDPETIAVPQKSSLEVTASATATEQDGAATSLSYAWTVTGTGLTLSNEDKATVTVTAAKTATLGSATLTLTVTATADDASLEITPATKTQTFTLTVTEGDFYPYTLYTQDFEAVTDISSVIITDTVNTAYAMTTSLETDNTQYGKALSNNARDATATIRTGLPTSYKKDYKVEFDMQLRGSVQSASWGGAQQAQFTLGNSEIDVTNNKARSYYSGGYLFALYNTATKGVDGSNNTWYLGLDATATETVTLDYSKWYHFLVVVDEEGENVTLTITQGNDTIYSAEIAHTTTAFTNINMINGKANGFFSIDNISVKGASDAIVITTPEITVDPAATIDYNGTATLTAESTAYSAATGNAVNVSYAWAVSSAYASVTSGENSAIATITAANNTISKRTVVATVTATPTGGTAVTNTQTITINPNAALLSAPGIAGVETVNEDSSIVLTLTGGENQATGDDAETAVTYSWETSDATKASITVAEDGKSVTVNGLETASDPVSITVTATLGDIVKTATKAITVAPGTLSRIKSITNATAGDTAGTFTATVLDGLTSVLTATANAAATTWTWGSSDTDVVTVAYTSEEGATNSATLTGVAQGNATITVTAVNGDNTATATIAVTVKEKTKSLLYSQNYDDVGTTSIVNNYRLNGANKVPSLQATKDGVTTVLATTLGSETFEVADGCLNWTGTASKGRYLNTMENLGASITSGAYGVSFDIKLGNSVTYLSLVDSTTLGATNLDILTKQAITDNATETLLLLGLSGSQATLYSAGSATETTFEYDNDSWYRFTVSGSTGTNQTMKLTVTKVSDESSVLAETSYNAVSAAGIPWVIHLFGTGATVALDNIEVYTYVAAE